MLNTTIPVMQEKRSKREDVIECLYQGIPVNVIIEEGIAATQYVYAIRRDIKEDLEVHFEKKQRELEEFIWEYGINISGASEALNMSYGFILQGIIIWINSNPIALEHMTLDIIKYKEEMDYE